MLEKGLRCGEGGGGAEEAAGHGLAYPVDSYVVGALTAEGSVDPGRDVYDVWREGGG